MGGMNYQGSEHYAPGPKTPMGFEQISSIGSNIAISLSSIPTGALHAMISVETANVRWRDDGNAPTTAIGLILPTGLAAWAYTGTLSAIKFISVGAAAKINVAYYK